MRTIQPRPTRLSRVPLTRPVLRACQCESPLRRTRVLALAAALFLTAAAAIGAEAPLRVTWSATDTQGRMVALPDTRPTVVLFIRLNQPQSTEAIDKAKTVFKTRPNVQVIGVISGPDAAASAAALLATNSFPWPLVADTDYAASGLMNIHVWPATVVFKPSGEQVARLRGMSSAYATELDAYTAFAAGAIDDAALAAKLNPQTAIEDSPEQKADRHLQVAKRLLDKGLIEPAASEVDIGLKLQPTSVALQLERARLLILSGNPADALTIADKWQGNPAARPMDLALLRGRALAALKRYDEALAALYDAVKLNPDPAEGYYALGAVYEAQNRWPDAAAAYRRAFEATPTGRATVATPSSPGSPGSNSSPGKPTTAPAR